MLSIPSFCMHRSFAGRCSSGRARTGIRRSSLRTRLIRLHLVILPIHASRQREDPLIHPSSDLSERDGGIGNTNGVSRREPAFGGNMSGVKPDLQYSRISIRIAVSGAALTDGALCRNRLVLRGTPLVCWLEFLHPIAEAQLDLVGDALVLRVVAVQRSQYFQSSPVAQEPGSVLNRGDVCLDPVKVPGLHHQDQVECRQQMRRGDPGIVMGQVYAAFVNDFLGHRQDWPAVRALSAGGSDDAATFCRLAALQKGGRHRASADVSGANEKDAPRTAGNRWSLQCLSPPPCFQSSFDLRPDHLPDGEGIKEDLLFFPHPGPLSPGRGEGHQKVICCSFSYPRPLSRRERI